MVNLELMIKLIVDWGARCFGMAHMTDHKVWAVRFIEEATELAQALGVGKDQLHKVIDVVYSRPKGEANQEAGGTFVTFLALCFAANIDPQQALETEVLRCLAKSPETFAKRNTEKLELGLTGQ